MDAYVLPRFIHYSQKRVRKVITERDGAFIAVIFENKEVEIFDLRKENKDVCIIYSSLTQNIYHGNVPQ